MPLLLDTTFVFSPLHVSCDCVFYKCIIFTNPAFLLQLSNMSFVFFQITRCRISLAFQGYQRAFAQHTVNNGHTTRTDNCSKIATKYFHRTCIVVYLGFWHGGRQGDQQAGGEYNKTHTNSFKFISYIYFYL